jgi:hypothetical protein
MKCDGDAVGVGSGLGMRCDGDIVRVGSGMGGGTVSRVGIIFGAASRSCASRSASRCVSATANLCLHVYLGIK